MPIGKPAPTLPLGLFQRLDAPTVARRQLNDANSVAATRSHSISAMISSDSDVNLTQTLTELSRAQTACQAALQSGASLLNSSLSLMNYISTT